MYSVLNTSSKSRFSGPGNILTLFGRSRSPWEQIMVHIEGLKFEYVHDFATLTYLKTQAFDRVGRPWDHVDRFVLNN